MQALKSFVLITVLSFGSVLSAHSALELAKEKISSPRCHGYCLVDFQVETDGFFYYEAQKCTNCASVTLKCSTEHFEDGSNCQSCHGSCPGHSYTDCTEVRELDTISSPVINNQFE